mgnify:FL=1
MWLSTVRVAGQKPFSFNVGLGKVIRGWDEGFMTMKLGEQARLTITGAKCCALIEKSRDSFVFDLTFSGDYGYGEGGFPAWGIPANATLLFDVRWCCAP